MTKRIALCALAGFCAAFLGSAGLASPPDDKPCPMKQLKQGFYCEKDSQILEAKDVKKNKHVGCESPVVKIRICAPKVYKCAGADGKDCMAVSLRPTRCKCKQAMKLFEEKPSAIQYQCSGCGVKGFNRAKLAHDKDQDKAAKKKTVKLVCEHGAAQ